MVFLEPFCFVQKLYVCEMIRRFRSYLDVRKACSSLKTGNTTRLPPAHVFQRAAVVQNPWISEGIPISSDTRFTQEGVSRLENQQMPQAVKPIGCPIGGPRQF